VSTENVNVQICGHEGSSWACYHIDLIYEKVRLIDFDRYCSPMSYEHKCRYKNTHTFCSKTIIKADRLSVQIGFVANEDGGKYYCMADLGKIVHMNIYPMRSVQFFFSN
jgi:hypothetical protein